MLSQLQILVKKLGSVGLQTEKTKDRDSSPKQCAKGKNKSVKDKTKLVEDSSTPYRYYKAHVANTESSSSTMSESDKDRVEIATFCQNIKLLSWFKAKKPKPQPKTVEFQPSWLSWYPTRSEEESWAVTALEDNACQRSRLEGVADIAAALVDNTQSWCSKLGRATDTSA